MKILRTVVILALFVSAMTFSGCIGDSTGSNANLGGSGPKSNVDNVNSPKSNVEELGMLVNLPYEPEDEDVVWKADGENRQLTAVLRFSTSDADSFVAEVSAHQAPQDTTISNETWFPPELIAQGDMSGDDSLRGIAYSAEKFYQEPYVAGRVVRIEGTDFFVLELTAK